MSILYDLLFLTVVIITWPIWLIRLIATGKWSTDWPGRFGKAAVKPRDEGDTRPTVLLYAVSLGEVNALRALVDALAEQTAGRWRIVIASTTNTGFDRAVQLFADRFEVVRYPLDFGTFVKRFLRRVRPDLVALMELEVWPCFVKQATHRGAKVCVINGRLSERSFTRYRKIAGLVRPSFARLAAAAVQTHAIADRFKAMGVPADRVRVLDTMKWDTAVIGDDVPGSDALARAMGIDRGKPLVVAGSTGPGEEKLLLDTCPADVQLLVVPRKPERFEEVAQLTDFVRRSQHGDDNPRDVDGRRLFMLDTMGELGKAYALADVVLVGRSFLGLYGSNVLEPIALGKPTIIGTHHSDFADIMAGLIEADGIIVTDQPMAAVRELLADRDKADALARRGRDVILSRQGATQRHVDLLVSLMANKAN